MTHRSWCRCTRPKTMKAPLDLGGFSCGDDMLAVVAGSHPGFKEAVFQGDYDGRTTFGMRLFHIWISGVCEETDLQG